LDNNLNSRKYKNLILKYLKNDDIHSLNTLIKEDPKKIFTPLLSLSYINDEEIVHKILDAFFYSSKLLISKDIEVIRNFVRRLIWMLTEESGGIPWMAPAILGAVISSDKSLANEYFNILISYIYESEDEPENYLEHIPLRANVYLGILKVLNNYPELINDNKRIIDERMQFETDDKIVNYLKEIEKLYSI